MAKVVALSGAQGGGKSTLLLGLEAKGWALDSFRVSRAVQKQLGWDSLDRVMDSVETMKEFQTEVLQQKFKNDLQLARRRPQATIFLTERSFADIAAYTTYWCWEHVDRRNWSFAEAAAWLSSYLERCREAQGIYAGIMLLPLMSNVTWQEDPNRAKRNTANLIYEDIRRFCDHASFIRQPRLEIKAASVEDRVSEANTWLYTI